MQEHEWVKLKDDIASVGISLYAKKELGDIVNINLPKVGKKVKKGEEVCILEAMKSAFEITSPFDGTVVEVNEKLKNGLEDLNEDPENKGWLFKIKIE